MQKLYTTVSLLSIAQNLFFLDNPVVELFFFARIVHRDFHDFDFLVVVREARIQRQKPLVQAEFHFRVGNRNRVAAEFFFVILDCKIAGLVKHRDWLVGI